MTRQYRFATPDYDHDAQYRGWGPGWPTDRSADMHNVTVGTVLAGNAAGTDSWEALGTQTFSVHKDIAQLTGIVLATVQRMHYKLISGWCWSYENRPIAGTQIPSNHSWGLAIDLNAPDNPYTSPRVTDMPSYIPDLFAHYGYAWGGDYTGKTDSMHYEFMGTPAQARQALAAALKELVNQGDDDMSAADVQSIKNAIQDSQTTIIHTIEQSVENRLTDHNAALEQKLPGLIQDAIKAAK